MGFGIMNVHRLSEALFLLTDAQNISSLEFGAYWRGLQMAHWSSWDLLEFKRALLGLKSIFLWFTEELKIGFGRFTGSLKFTL